MVRHSGVWALFAFGALIVVIVLGFAAKVGMDTSRYLETVSEQRNWTAPAAKTRKPPPACSRLAP